MSESGDFDRSALLSDWSESVINSVQEHKDKLVCVGKYVMCSNYSTTTGTTGSSDQP